MLLVREIGIPQRNSVAAIFVSFIGYKKQCFQNEGLSCNTVLVCNTAYYYVKNILIEKELKTPIASHIS